MNNTDLQTMSKKELEALIGSLTSLQQSLAYQGDKWTAVHYTKLIIAEHLGWVKVDAKNINGWETKEWFK
jgi:hypothetical protein